MTGKSYEAEKFLENKKLSCTLKYFRPKNENSASIPYGLLITNLVILLCMRTPIMDKGSLYFCMSYIVPCHLWKMSRFHTFQCSSTMAKQSIHVAEISFACGEKRFKTNKLHASEEHISRSQAKCFSSEFIWM